MLITNNDIIIIVGPTAKQPQLEILHSSGSDTEDVGTLTETDILAENVRSKRASGLTQPKYDLTNGENRWPLVQLFIENLLGAQHSARPREELYLFIHSLCKYLLSTYYKPHTLLGTQHITLNPTDKNHCYHWAYIPVGEINSKQIFSKI